MLTRKLPNAAASLITVTTTAQFLVDLIIEAGGEPFSVVGLDAIDMQVNGNIRFLADGNTPTSTEGMLVTTFKTLRGVDLSKLQLISPSGNVTVSIQVGNTKQGETDETESEGGGGIPGGNDTELQYNNAGVFGGITGVESDGFSIFLKSGAFLQAYDSTDTTAYIVVGGANISGVETLQLFDGRFLWVIGGNTLAITDPNGTSMQTLALNRNVNTANTIGSYNFTALNASSAPKNYAELTAEVVSGTAGAENGKWNLRAVSAGTVTTSLEGNGTGINIPNAGTAGSPSVTVNSTNSGFYAQATNGVALSVAGSQVWRATSAGGITMDSRFQTNRASSNVASATSVSLGTGGNLFNITGSTTISRISSTNWNNGAFVTLILPSGLTLEHLSASGTGAQMNLAGGVDFTTSAITYITFLLDTQWTEMYRRVL